MPITIAEATLGGEIRVPLLRGTATLKIPPGVRSGSKLRLKGRGITDSKGRSGDLHAVLEIVAPTAEELSDEHRAALEALGRDLANPRIRTPWAAEIIDG